MISGKTFLKFIVVKIADEVQAGSSNAWRITIYNGTAQDNTQLCFTNFLRYYVVFNFDFLHAKIYFQTFFHYTLKDLPNI
jgi:hypothetical protein